MGEVSRGGEGRGSRRNTESVGMLPSPLYLQIRLHRGSRCHGRGPGPLPTNLCLQQMPREVESCARYGCGFGRGLREESEEGRM